MCERCRVHDAHAGAAAALLGLRAQSAADAAPLRLLVHAQVKRIAKQYLGAPQRDDLDAEHDDADECGAAGLRGGVLAHNDVAGGILPRLAVKCRCVRERRAK